ncbi:MAG: 3-phosphoshikimate 1-carboxyvinyltransferase [Clostridia bacterium]
MAKVRIYPGTLSGTIAAPPSKSQAHRALVLAALSRGAVNVGPIEESDDVRATLMGISALGAHLTKLSGNLVRVNGLDAKRHRAPALIDCRESGSTLRFLLPASLAVGSGAHFVGRGRLGQRPMRPYEDLCRAQDILYERGSGSGLDLTVSGKLKSGEIALPGDISSQFVSGLLMALPLVSGQSRIKLVGPIESKGYIDMTLRMMAAFGAQVETKDGRLFTIAGGQRYKGRDVLIEGDYSQAAVFLCAAALGADVTVTGLPALSDQADQAVLDHLMHMGADLSRGQRGVRVRGGELRGAVIDASQCPDVVPMLALTCALSSGESRIVNASRLRYKESDRLHATCEELTRLGAQVLETDDGLIIQGNAHLTGCDCQTHGDHRIAMMLAIAALHASGATTLDDAQCLSKSYPGFLKDFEALGGIVCGGFMG